MTRRDTVTGLPPHAGHCPLWLLGGMGAILLVLAGCSHTAQQRGQAADESELYHAEIPTIGDRTTVGNAEPIPLGAVGLVTGLEGTGGDCAHDSYRSMLADNLRKEGVRNVQQLLNSPSTALVIVEAYMPPGANKDDSIDVQVKLPPGSKATSLRGGVLHKCRLYNYDFARNLRPDYNGGDGLLLGHARAVAEGSVLVGVGDGDESARAKSGRIWSGGRVTVGYPLALVMNPNYQLGSLTALITERINATFTAGLRGALDTRLASTGDKYSVALRVPAQYRLNLERYLRVVRLIPLGDSADMPFSKGEDHRSYRQRLADDLLDPAKTVVAALRLEALGSKSIPALREGLKSKHPLVRFCSAEALAYLGSPACGEELAQVVKQYPILRVFALTALASLDEAICHIKLKELVQADLDDEARIGAFRALFALSPNDPLVRGEWLNDSFWLHRIDPKGRPMVHVSTSKRAEIVLFGEMACLKPPFSFLAGEFSITATADDTRCTISRFPVGGAPARKQCSLELEDVLRTMAELGGQYPEVIALLQQAGTCDSLSCRIRVDALPQSTSVFDLAKAGQEGTELVPAGQDLGRTPTLYSNGLPSSAP
jgi:flagellar basal body P-ring protein FlgI